MKTVNVWHAEQRTPHAPNAPCWCVSIYQDEMRLSTLDGFTSEEEAYIYASNILERLIDHEGEGSD